MNLYVQDEEGSFENELSFDVDCGSDGLAEIRLFTAHEEPEGIFGYHNVTTPDECVELANNPDVVKYESNGRCYYRLLLACPCTQDESPAPSEMPSDMPSMALPTPYPTDEECVKGDVTSTQLASDFDFSEDLECPEDEGFLCVGLDYEGRYELVADVDPSSVGRNDVLWCKPQAEGAEDDGKVGFGI